MRVKPFDRLDADDTLMLGLVRKHRRPRHISDRVDSRDIGFVELINDDDPAIGFDTELFQPEVLDISDHSNGGYNALDGDRLRLVALLYCRGYPLRPLVRVV